VSEKIEVSWGSFSHKERCSLLSMKKKQL